MNNSKLGKKITNKEYDLKLEELNLVRIDDYINTNTSIYHKCKFCDKKFKKKPKEVKNIKCNCLVKKEEYNNRIIQKNIKLIGNYISMRTKSLHNCQSCGLNFMTAPKNIINSVIGCPSCSGKKFSTEKYKSLLPNDIIIKDEIYDGSNKLLTHICNICNKSWKTKPNYIIHMKCGCPYCNFSKGEKQIYKFLDKLCIRYEKQKIININNKEYRFDFYLPDINIFIEYDGIQHYEPVDYFGGVDQFKLTVESDNIKNKWCHDQKIDLIRIGYMVDDIESYLAEKILSL